MSTPLERLLEVLPNARLCSLEVIADAYCAAEDRAIKAEARVKDLQVSVRVLKHELSQAGEDFS